MGDRVEALPEDESPSVSHVRAMALGLSLREHRPQSRFLSLISLGDREAAADRGPFSASGPWVWKWKDAIDSGFMRRFSELPAAMPEHHFAKSTDSCLPS